MLADHFRQSDPVARAVKASDLPERTLKRRFKTATGASMNDLARFTIVDDHTIVLLPQAKRHRMLTTDFPPFAVGGG